MHRLLHLWATIWLSLSSVLLVSAVAAADGSIFRCPKIFELDVARVRFSLSEDLMPLTVLPLAPNVFPRLSPYPYFDDSVDFWQPSQLIGVTVNFDLCIDCTSRYFTRILAHFSEFDLYDISSAYTGTFYLYAADPYAPPNVFRPLKLLEFPIDVAEHGIYNYRISAQWTTNDTHTNFTPQILGFSVDRQVLAAPRNAYLPLQIVGGLLLGIFILSIVIGCIRHYEQKRRNVVVRNSIQVDSQYALLDRLGTVNVSINGQPLQAHPQIHPSVPLTSTPTPLSTHPIPFESLHTFRGICLFILIFVNYGAGGYVELDHAIWNGLNLADLIFPWFIFLMGISMAINFHYIHQQTPIHTSQQLKIIFIRTFKLSFVSLMTNITSTPLNYLRIPGVMMRFATSYFIVALILLWIPKYQSSSTQDSILISAGYTSASWFTRIRREFQRMTWLKVYLYEYLLMLCILFLWIGLTFGVDVPNECGRGYLGPGGPLVDHGMKQDCTGGANGYIDQQLFGIHHIHQVATTSGLYLTGPYDSEGFLGSLTTILLVWIGVMAGRIMVDPVYQDAMTSGTNQESFNTHDHDHEHTSVHTRQSIHRIRMFHWCVYGLVLGLIGLALCGFDPSYHSQGLIPINKNLWSLSFILLLGSLALFILTFLYWMIDIHHHWSGHPFVAMGMNALSLFVVSTYVQNHFPFTLTYPTDANGCSPDPSHGWLLFTNLLGSVLFGLIAQWMHAVKFYVHL